MAFGTTGTNASKPYCAQQLLRDATAGTLNKGEFLSLDSRANFLEEKRAQFLQDGRLSADEAQELGQLEQQFQDKYAEYRSRDVNVAFGDLGSRQAPNPVYALRERHHQQAGDLYDRLQSGEVSDEEAVRTLLRNRGERRQLGSRLPDDSPLSGARPDNSIGPRRQHVPQDAYLPGWSAQPSTGPNQMEMLMYMLFMMQHSWTSWSPGWFMGR